MSQCEYKDREEQTSCFSLLFLYFDNNIWSICRSLFNLKRNSFTTTTLDNRYPGVDSASEEESIKTIVILLGSQIMAFMLQVSLRPVFLFESKNKTLFSRTDVVIEGPAFKGGLRVGDKILSCNGYDFTMVSHKQAVDLIKRNHSLKLLVARKGVTQQ